MDASKMRSWFFLAAFSIGWVMSACTDSSEGTEAQPCINGACSEGYMCTTGYCVPIAAETGGETTDGHGTIRIEISPVGGDASIFAGTTSVTATVNYESCLQDFYIQQSPEFNQDGPEGMPVFEAWLDKLCSDFTNTAVCQVVQIKQTLIPDNDVYSLSVDYNIGDPEDLAGTSFHVGPLPTTELAGCPAVVEVRQTGLVGRDADDNPIWVISTLPGNNTAATDQGTSVHVEVKPPASP